MEGSEVDIVRWYIEKVLTSYAQKTKPKLMRYLTFKSKETQGADDWLRITCSCIISYDVRFIHIYQLIAMDKQASTETNHHQHTISVDSCFHIPATELASIDWATDRGDKRMRRRHIIDGGRLYAGVMLKNYELKIKRGICCGFVSRHQS